MESGEALARLVNEAIENKRYAEVRFNMAADEDVDLAISELYTAELRLSKYLKEAKDKGIKKGFQIKMY